MCLLACLPSSSLSLSLHFKFSTSSSWQGFPDWQLSDFFFFYICSWYVCSHSTFSFVLWADCKSHWFCTWTNCLQACCQPQFSIFFCMVCMYVPATSSTLSTSHHFVELACSLTAFFVNPKILLTLNVLSLRTNGKAHSHHLNCNAVTTTDLTVHQQEKTKDHQQTGFRISFVVVSPHGSKA